MNETHYMSISEIHRGYKEKTFSVREFVMACLNRIAAVDKGPNGLNAVLELNPDALFIAAALDVNREAGAETPPLFGVPVLLKDNINTGDKLRTSAGSVALGDNFAKSDAYLVKCLRKAGAVILGKANMTEFANYMSKGAMPSGYSSRGGQVINPYDRGLTPSGSSSGSAVAVAAGLCPVSVGTETSGSIISPAMYNGVVGIKPTIGLISRAGVIPISSTLDTAGPMARNVTDAAALLTAMARYDKHDAATYGNRIRTDYGLGLDAKGLKGLRIGILRPDKRDDDEKTKEETAAFNKLIRVLSDSGAEVVDGVGTDLTDITNGIMDIMRYEFKDCINYYLKNHGGSSLKSLSAIVAYNQANARTALKYGQERLMDCENNTTGTMTEQEYIKALGIREKAIRTLGTLFNIHKLDILLCEGYFTGVAPLTGFPAMTIPIGQRSGGQPIGSYWIAPPYREQALIKAAYGAERALGLKLRPELGRESKEADEKHG